jgi:hypothetical protein
MVMKRPRNWKTAEQLNAELEADPAYRAMKDRRDRESLEKTVRLMAAEAPLVRELASAGVHIESVWDLVNTKASYSPAIPVLLDHLPRGYPPEIRAGIARALAVKEASWAWDVLRQYFLREPEGGRSDVKWALACAVSGAADDEQLEKVIELITDESLGLNRLPLLAVLARSKNQSARDTLDKLRADRQLGREVRRLFGRPRKSR